MSSIRFLCIIKWIFSILLHAFPARSELQPCVEKDDSILDAIPPTILIFLMFVLVVLTGLLSGEESSSFLYLMQLVNTS